MGFVPGRTFGFHENRQNHNAIPVTTIEEFNRALTRIYQSEEAGAIQVCAMIPILETIILQQVVPTLRIFASGDAGFYNASAVEFPLFTLEAGDKRFIFRDLNINQSSQTKFSGIFATSNVDFAQSTYIDATGFTISGCNSIFSAGIFIGASLQGFNFSGNNPVPMDFAASGAISYKSIYSGFTSSDSGFSMQDATSFRCDFIGFNFQIAISSENTIVSYEGGVDILTAGQSVISGNLTVLSGDEINIPAESSNESVSEISTRSGLNNQTISGAAATVEITSFVPNAINGNYYIEYDVIAINETAATTSVYKFGVTAISTYTFVNFVTYYVSFVDPGLTFSMNWDGTSIRLMVAHLGLANYSIASKYSVTGQGGYADI